MTSDENRGYKFYRECLKSPKFILAPMVDASEYPFRELCRNHGTQLAYTPMIACRPFVESAKIRNDYLYRSNYDRPLIAQFCANDVELFLKAIELAKDYCDAIDINLGCPQNIARKGHYGAFLQDEWDLVSAMIQKATEKFPDLPITCKIRVFNDEQRTIEYAKMIERSGCYLLTVHGRTREMKGQFTGLADWRIIKRVKEQLSIPVFANGNIQTLQDAVDCLEFTGVDGVMSAEGLYSNPALFSGLHIPCWQLIDEYLTIVRSRPKAVSYPKNHIFRMANFSLQLPENGDLRDKLGRAFSVEQFQAISTELRRRYELNENQTVPMTNQPLPHYLTQPYYHFTKSPDGKENGPVVDENGKEVCTSEKKRKKKRQKIALHRPKKSKGMVNCSDCKIHPKGQTCDNDLCRICCKSKCFGAGLSCVAHRFNVKNKKPDGAENGSQGEQHDPEERNPKRPREESDTNGQSDSKELKLNGDSKELNPKELDGAKEPNEQNSVDELNGESEKSQSAEQFKQSESTERNGQIELTEHDRPQPLTSCEQ